MTHGSLFSGIGGFDYAAHLMGWDNEFHCEINKFCQQILKYYWPNATSYEDITKTDFSIWHGRIDILTGGFPCQPFSVAGSRKGKEDDRYLWPEMLRAINEIGPAWVCGENVAGIATMVQPETFKTKVESQTSIFGEDDEEIVTEWQEYVIETVCYDLERIGYSVQPVIIPACAVGAPHKRDRIWFVANANNHARWRAHSKRFQADQRFFSELEGFGTQRIATNSCSNGLKRTNVPTNVNDGRIQKGMDERLESESLYGTGLTANSKSEGSGRQLFEQQGKGKFGRQDCGAVGVAPNPDSYERCERGMHEEKSKEAERHTGTFDTRGDWGAWQDFPTQSPVCSGDDGLPTELDGITFSKWRNESIKGYGNAIVPQVAMEIFKAIEEYENLF